MSRDGSIVFDDLISEHPSDLNYLMPSRRRVRLLSTTTTRTLPFATSVGLDSELFVTSALRAQFEFSCAAKAVISLSNWSKSVIGELILSILHR